MQLLLLFLLLASGRGGDFRQLRPVLESLGGEDVKSALREAERLQGVMSAFAGAAGDNGKQRADDAKKREKESGTFPLAPVSGIANAEILAALARYFAAPAA